MSQCHAVELYWMERFTFSHISVYIHIFTFLDLIVILLVTPEASNANFHQDTCVEKIKMYRN